MTPIDMALAVLLDALVQEGSLRAVPSEGLPAYRLTTPPAPPPPPASPE